MKRLQKVLLTAIAGSLCFSSGVMADSLVKSIKADQRKDIAVTKSYQKQWLRDGNGKTVYPIMYEGNTYLPLRNISDLVGAEVTWDGANKSINIEPKTVVQYVQKPCNHDTTNSDKNNSTSSKNPTYKDLTTKDKSKVDDYKDEIDKLEAKIKKYEDKLDDLEDDEYDAKRQYDKTGSNLDRDKLNKIRDDIKHYEDLIDDLEDDIENYEDKIDAIYDKYK